MEKDYEKTINMPIIQNNKNSFKDINNKNINKNNFNKKKMNKRLSYLKKAKLNNKIKNISSSLVSIEQFKTKRNGNIVNDINYNNKLRIIPYDNYLLDKNNFFSGRRNFLCKEKNIFSQIIFSILNNNRDKIENKFEFKLHKPSNINISTMLELTKRNKIKSTNKV